MIKKPIKLKRGDRIGIFLPSSSVKDEYRKKGLAEILDLGYVPVEVNNIFSDLGYFAKSSEEVLDDLNNFFSDNSIKALWAARGGYGSNFITNKLDVFKNISPKIIIGSSDVSYLLWKMMDITEMTVFYGPMVFSTMAEKRYDRENLIDIIEGNYEKIRIEGKVLKGGKADKIVTGGCLSNLSSLCGTEYFPEIKNRILLLEDTNEKPYRLDRMLWQLAECNVFSNISGIIFGELPGCFRGPAEKIKFYRSIDKYFRDYDYPVIFDMPFGHSSYVKTLPLGIKIQIDTAGFEGITIEEKGVI